MAPYTNIPLSPAELSYLHTSLSQIPPLRPDGRSPTQFRPLVAETDLLPNTNGSARICFADGTEAIVGVKAEVEKTRASYAVGGEEGDRSKALDADIDMGDEEEEGSGTAGKTIGQGRDEWLEVAIEIPGLRDDDALPVFLSAMLTEALHADSGLKDRLWMNSRFHWRLYIDILLLSQPLSYPLPLLSLTTHLALLSTRLPTLVSEKDEDPLFNDDWEASSYLYPRSQNLITGKPPITLLVMSVGETILFDPSREELAVADSVLAISITQAETGDFRVVAMRSVDPPSRLTAAGVPTSLNTTAGGTATTLSTAETLQIRELDQSQSVWRPPRGGVRRGMIAKMLKMVVEKGGVGREVMDGLANVEV